MSSEAFHFDSSENPFESDALHKHETSDNPFESGDISDEKEACDNISDEKAAWNNSNPYTHVIDSARDQDNPNMPSYPLGSNLRPISATSSLYSLKNGQLNSPRASQRSYMEERSEFYAGMDDEPKNYVVDDDDDDDDWGDSNLKKRLDSTICRPFSVRGILNMGAVALLALGLVVIFGVLPIITYQSSHRQTEQLSANGGGLNPVNASDPRQNTITRRRLDGTGHLTSISGELTTDESLQSGVYPPLNVAHHWNKWETSAVKNRENQPLLPVEKTKATFKHAKRSRREIIDVKL